MKENKKEDVCAVIDWKILAKKVNKLKENVMLVIIVKENWP
jgi:hypothetical protein